MTSVVHTLDRAAWFLADYAETLHATAEQEAAGLIAEAEQLAVEIRKILASVGDCDIAIVPIARAWPRDRRPS